MSFNYLENSDYSKLPEYQVANIPPLFPCLGKWKSRTFPIRYKAYEEVISPECSKKNWPGKKLFITPPQAHLSAPATDPLFLHIHKAEQKRLKRHCPILKNEGKTPPIRQESFIRTGRAYKKIYCRLNKMDGPPSIHPLFEKTLQSKLKKNPLETTKKDVKLSQYQKYRGRIFRKSFDRLPSEANKIDSLHYHLNEIRHHKLKRIHQIKKQETQLLSSPFQGKQLEKEDVKKIERLRSLLNKAKPERRTHNPSITPVPVPQVHPTQRHRDGDSTLAFFDVKSYSPTGCISISPSPRTLPWAVALLALWANNKKPYKFLRPKALNCNSPGKRPGLDTTIYGSLKGCRNLKNANVDGETQGLIKDKIEERALHSIERAFSTPLCLSASALNTFSTQRLQATKKLHQYLADKSVVNESNKTLLINEKICHFTRDDLFSFRLSRSLIPIVNKPNAKSNVSPLIKKQKVKQQETPIENPLSCPPSKPSPTSIHNNQTNPYDVANVANIPRKAKSQEPLPLPPINLNAKKIPNGHIRLTWEPPPTEAGGAHPVLYKVFLNQSLTECAGYVPACSDRLCFEYSNSKVQWDHQFFIISVSSTNQMSSPASIHCN